jgi:2-aminoadipate transaminase
MGADELIESMLSPFARAAPPAAGSGRSTPAIEINFDQGLPDPSQFPVAALRDELVAVLDEAGATALAYYGDGGPADMRYGHLGLRDAIAERTARRDGRSPGTDGVTLVNGSTDGLSLAVRTFLGPGDGAVVEHATYRHTWNFMVSTGATVRRTGTDEHGMTIDGLERTLDELEAAGAPPKLIYTVPTFQAPTGSVLPAERREALVELAARRRVMVLEDNCYHELGYDGPPPPTLFALDRAGVVIHSDSFSKYLAPGLRIGWLAADPAAVVAVTRVRQDFSVSQLMARAVERIVRSGRLDTHLRELRHHYRAKRDLTEELLRRHCGELVRFHTPAGGFFFWLEVADEVDPDAMAEELAQRGVGVRGGEWFTGDADGRRFLRLSPMQLADEDIERGLVLLGEALERARRVEAR